MTTNQVIPFDFDGRAVRVMQIDGEPWFVGKDVALVLGYTNPPKAIRDHCKAGRPVGVNEPFTLDQQTVVIPERDVYRLIMRSKMPRAEAFEEHVVGVILPTIRKTGGYGESSVVAAMRQEIAEMRLGFSEMRLALAALREDPYTRIAADMMTALEVRNEHVIDRKCGPRPAAISNKLIAWIGRNGSLGSVHRTRERDGAKRLFQRADVHGWLQSEGQPWIITDTAKRRGQGVLKLVPKDKR